MIILNEKAKEILLKELKEKFGKEVTIREITKDNGMKLTGIEVKENENISPVLYLENYHSCNDMEELVKRIVYDYERYIASYPVESLKVSVKNISKDSILNTAKFILVNTEWNKEEIGKFVSRDLPELGLTILYYYTIYADGEVKATSKLKKDMAEITKVSEEEIYEAAFKNMKSDFNFINLENIFCVNKNIKEMIKKEEIFSRTFGMPEMFILTNERGEYGAEQLLNTELLTEISEELDRDLYIIPSSINEIMIMPYFEECNDFNEFIEDVNDSSVPENQRLANKPFLFKKGEKNLTVIQ